MKCLIIFIPRDILPYLSDITVGSGHYYLKKTDILGEGSVSYEGVGEEGMSRFLRTEGTLVVDVKR